MSLTDQKVSDYTLRLRIVFTLLPSFIHLSTLTSVLNLLIPRRYLFFRGFIVLLLFTDGTNRTSRITSLYRLHRFAFLCAHTCSEFPLNGLLWSTWAFPPLIPIKIVLLEGFHMCNICLCYCCTINGNWDRLSLQKSIPLSMFWSSIFINLNNIFTQYRQFHEVSKT